MPGGWVGLAWRPGAGTPSTAGELRVAHDVFISYSSSDRNIANAVCARLEANGVRCWIAPRDIPPGTSWGSAIIRALSEARVMVLLFSLKANKSPQILREVERAVGRGVVIVPVRIEDVQPQDDFEYFLSSQHWLDILTHPLEEHLDKLCVVVKQVLAAPSSAGENGATKEVREAVPVAEPAGIPPPPPAWAEAETKLLSEEDLPTIFAGTRPAALLPRVRLVGATTHTLAPGTTTVGRGVAATLRIDDRKASRAHAEIIVTADEVTSRTRAV